ncbi:uncharacterized protein PMUG01_00052100 [Plasmodium malariae]|uniref:Pv-fam-d protein n=2 Tax=Plasmodium (Plasmodium) TaxID=418103 RepID=A0A1D3JHB8_PLAMA|nr:uncharacterized protein PMUG01_00052100 [Plasmodium malariae]SBT85698.1 hypothetical protein PMUG01_00052100 [Plasmodium malariae]
MKILRGESNENSLLNGKILETEYYYRPYVNYYDDYTNNYNDFKELYKREGIYIYKKKNKKSLLNSIVKTLKKYDKQYEEDVMDAFFSNNIGFISVSNDFSSVASNIFKVISPVLAVLVYFITSCIYFSSIPILLVISFMVFIFTVVYTLKKIAKCYIKTLSNEKKYML